MHLTQTQMGELLGVGIRIVQRWERGDRAISAPADRLLRNIVTGQDEPMGEDDDDGIASRIRLIMKEKKLNYRQLAELTNYTDVSVGKIAKGVNKPKFDLLKNIISKMPDLNARWLLTGEGTMEVSPDAPEKRLSDFHALEIINFIDENRKSFLKLSLCKTLLQTFINEGVLSDEGISRD